MAAKKNKRTALPVPTQVEVSASNAVAVRRRGRPSKYADLAKKIVSLKGDKSIIFKVPTGKSAVLVRGSIQTALAAAVSNIDPEFKISVYALPNNKQLMITRRGAKVKK
jgi:hypothetical protein